MCPLTVKILDAVKGTPAGPMGLALHRKTPDGGWTQIANGYQLKFTDIRSLSQCSRGQNAAVLHHRMTNSAGEIHNLVTEEAFLPGVYRVDFDTKSYWKKEGGSPFHEVTSVSLIGRHSSV